MPLLDDGRALDVSTAVWCTGFEPDLGWIDLPPLEPDRGVTTQQGLYVLGMLFQHWLASSMLQGVGADAPLRRRAPRRRTSPAAPRSFTVSPWVRRPRPTTRSGQ